MRLDLQETFKSGGGDRRHQGGNINIIEGGWSSFDRPEEVREHISKKKASISEQKDGYDDKKGNDNLI